ncbi:MAG TPA: hypothetical protein VGC87_17735 [Pyrinomonadaceae bacterium]|jgi:hypothetical protein
MARIFHQNMRRFGGNTIVRNAFFMLTFDAIRNAPGTGGAAATSFFAAGFTELSNSGLGLHANIPEIIQCLDVALTNVLVIEVGITAVGGDREFVAIATDPALYPITDAGHVLFNSMHNRWDLHNTPAGDIVDNRIDIPGGIDLQADSRGVAYVAGTYLHTDYLIGFMHNMCKEGNKSGLFEKLGQAANRMRQVPNYAAAHVVIGGDFNVQPRHTRPRNGGLQLYACCRTDMLNFPMYTTAANPYDYFMVSNVATTDADVEIYAQTRATPIGSDHSGVTLEV